MVEKLDLARRIICTYRQNKYFLVGAGMCLDYLGRKYKETYVCVKTMQGLKQITLDTNIVILDADDVFDVRTDICQVRIKGRRLDMYECGWKYSYGNWTPFVPRQLSIITGRLKPDSFITEWHRMEHKRNWRPLVTHHPCYEEYVLGHVVYRVYMRDANFHANNTFDGGWISD